MFARIASAALLLTATASAPPPQGAAADGQVRWAKQCKDWDEWDKPGPPYLIHGQTYYVGTCGISAILIVSPEGHTLIDSGTDAGAKVVAANIRKLGFRLADVNTLLNTHEHHDHVGGMARLQRLTGAHLVSSPRAAAVLGSGTSDSEDPQAMEHMRFPPAHVTDVLEMKDGEARILGATELRAVATPGHTPGALSWQWESCETKDRCLTIVYADSLTPVSSDGYRFSDHPAYLAAFRASLAKIASLKCDILLSPHPSASGMRDRLLRGSLVDPQGCEAYAARLSKQLDERLAKEADGR
uniref:subclass B3 metallo-beta-lactamase n=1 Tax=Altererythrobacter segetis TaxID=1104773 RepID=UPI00140881FC|nr:subclass B3 metallo-beta-lactamase [Altererythrobacter segetis]